MLLNIPIFGQILIMHCGKLSKKKSKSKMTGKERNERMREMLNSFNMTNSIVKNMPMVTFVGNYIVSLLACFLASLLS